MTPGRPWVLSFAGCFACLFVIAVPEATARLGAEEAKPSLVQPIWSGKPPGETKELPPEQDVTEPDQKDPGGKPIIRLTNVSIPTVSLYRPTKENDTGTAVVICPGGGHHILAFNHEGTETAEWLTTLGVTGIVLKYRVPSRTPDGQRWLAAVQDAQRAMSFVRAKASEWKLDPQRIGILGFSAGGETAALTSYFADRQYQPVDAVDQVSFRPDFAMLIYPAYFDKTGEPTKMREDVTITKDAPPTFLVHAWDDPVTVFSSLHIAAALTKAGVPAELHIYATGGHGYGMRDTGANVNTWPQRAADWLKESGLLTRPERPPVGPK
ncbi:MAG TPA: alpha/beta hydrolase [Pirellulales bacterium]|nr:alpha/beta hydrolase [Pirellulales bacterium]